MNRSKLPLPVIPLPYFLIALFLSITGALPAQMITTIAGGSIGDGKPATTIGISYLSGIQVDSAENLYFLDNTNYRLRKVSAATGIVSTIAGGAPSGNTGNGGPAVNAGILSTSSFTVDRSGNIYLTGPGYIRKIDAATGIITKITGNGPGYSGDGGLAINAGLSFPSCITTDTLGNIYFADGYRIRKITVATGIINTIAGTGTNGYSGDGGPAVNAQHSTITSIAADGDGNIYVTDNNNNVIRKIAAATGVITTAAGTGAQGGTGDGGLAIYATLAYSNAVVADKAGNIYILDNQRIRKVDAATGIINSIAGNGPYSIGFAPDGSSAYNAHFSNPNYLAISSTGNLYIHDRDNFVIRKIEAGTGLLNTVCGNRNQGTGGIGGPVAAAQLFRINSIATDKFNNIYLSDGENEKIYRIDAASSIISTVAGTGNQGINHGNGGPATSANILNPNGMAVDPDGNFYFSDNGIAVRKVSRTTGIITTVAGIGVQYGYSGDGGPATAAKINRAVGVTFDKPGNLYIADKENHVIRKVTTATGIITTVAGSGVAGYSGDNGLATAAKLNNPFTVTVDPSGNIYICDNGNNVIRRVDAITNIITTVAGTGTGGYSGDGGPATSAQLDYPYGITTDSAGNLFIADQFNWRIRKVTTTTGIITTIAGNGFTQNSNDSILAISSTVNNPIGLCFDASGHLLISEFASYRIRKLYDTVPKVITDVPSINNPNAIATKIYPNPTNGQAYLTLNGKLNGKMYITVADLWGTTLLTQQYFLQPANTYSTPLWLPGLQKGIYFVTVYVNKTKYVHKITVQ